MSQKSSSNKKKKSNNKTIYKAVSLLPTFSSTNLPVAYVKALPMVIGVVTILILLIIPATRNSFIYKTNILKESLEYSLKTGVSAYISQLQNNIEILPIDSDLDSKIYLGRVEIKNLDRVEAKTISEKAHFMTANISAGFKYLGN